MNGHDMEFLAGERMRERMQEAERHRLARSATRSSSAGRGIRAAIHRAVVRLSQPVAATWSRARMRAPVSEPAPRR